MNKCPMKNKSVHNEIFIFYSSKMLKVKNTHFKFVVRPTGVYLLDFFCSGIQFYVLLSPYLCFISFLYLDLYVLEMMH